MDFPEGRDLVRRAREADVPVLMTDEDDVIAGVPGMEIRILGPPAGALRLSRNDASLVALVRRGPSEALLTGDVGRRGVRHLESFLPGLAPDVVLLPHHGSRGSTSPRLESSAGSSVALVSARKGFTPEDVLDRYRRAGASVLATWQEGAIGVDITSDRTVARTFRGGWR
jgi:competence protein ComEC